MENNQELLTFLAANPKSTKEAIRAATSLNGLFLFNLLKKLVSENKVAEVDEDGIKLYSLGDVKHKGIAPELVKKEPVPKSADRDSSKYRFNGQKYGKGPLVRAIVEQYVKDNPIITYDELKKVFPNTLMPRLGVFEDVETAKKLARGGNRYFTKPEHIIKLANKKIVVCNQWTLALLTEFLSCTEALGFTLG